MGERKIEKETGAGERKRETGMRERKIERQEWEKERYEEIQGWEREREGRKRRSDRGEREKITNTKNSWNFILSCYNPLSCFNPVTDRLCTFW